MSGLLSRCPPLRAQAAHGANQVVCALLCALSACPRWSSALRSCRSPAFPRFPCCAHTWLRPHATVWAFLVFARVVEKQACCGRVCLRVAGVRVYARGVFVWVFALSGCWRFGGVVGQCGPAAPLPRLACLRAHALVWACWRVREPVGGQVRGGNGAGQSCPAPCAAGWRCRRCVRVEERRLRVGVPARSGEHNPTPSLVLAYMETGSHPVGAKQRGGATGRAWWSGWGRGAFLVRAP